MVNSIIICRNIYQLCIVQLCIIILVSDYSQHIFISIHILSNVTSIYEDYPIANITSSHNRFMEQTPTENGIPNTFS